MEWFGAPEGYLARPRLWCPNCKLFNDSTEISINGGLALHNRLNAENGQICGENVFIVVLVAGEPRFFQYMGFGNDQKRMNALRKLPEGTAEGKKTRGADTAPNKYQKSKSPGAASIGKAGSKPGTVGAHKASVIHLDRMASLSSRPDSQCGAVSPISIILDRHNHIYNPGEIISGKAIIVLDSPLSVSEVKISFIGEAHVDWRTSDQRFTDTEEIFNNVTKLWPSNGGPIQKSSPTMSAGRYEFNFALPVPEKTWKGLPLPGSIDFDEGANIRYFLEVHVVRPTFHFDQTHREFVSILEVYDLNADSLASVPIAVTDGKTIFSWCCTSGRIEASIKLPKRGYAIGENLAMSIEITNNSPRIVKQVRYQLIQECEFRTYSRSRTVETSQIAEVIKMEQVLPGQTRLWESEGFPIPSFTRPSMSAEVCRIIEYRHHLLVQVVTKGRSFNFDMRIPILIGTIPLTTPALDPRSIVKFQRNPVSKGQTLKV